MKKINLFDLNEHELTSDLKKQICGGKVPDMCAERCECNCGPTLPDYTWSNDGSLTAFGEGIH